MTSSSPTMRRRLHKAALCRMSTQFATLQTRTAGSQSEESNHLQFTCPGVNGALRLVYCSATVCSHQQRGLLLFALLPALPPLNVKCFAVLRYSRRFRRRFNGADSLCSPSPPLCSVFLWNNHKNLHLVSYPLL